MTDPHNLCKKQVMGREGQTSLNQAALQVFAPAGNPSDRIAEFWDIGREIRAVSRG